MGSKRIYSMIASVVLVVAIVSLLGFAVIPGSSSGTDNATVTASSGYPSEGITVHGHWTIEVINPDGTLAEHREFENALVPEDGSLTLCKILARQNSVGGYYISLLGSYGQPGAFLSDTAHATYGVLVESTLPDSRMSNNYFKTLTVNIGTGDDNLKLVLKGTATTQTDGDIGAVKTSIYMLRSSIPPSSSYIEGETYDDLTETVLSSPVNLTTGQIVTVTVVISFS